MHTTYPLGDDSVMVHHNGDWSGEVTLVMASSVGALLTQGSASSIVTLPMEVLVAVVACRLRDQAVSKIEGMSNDELLGRLLT